jgi:hypothetical protein
MQQMSKDDTLNTHDGSESLEPELFLTDVQLGRRFSPPVGGFNRFRGRIDSEITQQQFETKFIATASGVLVLLMAGLFGYESLTWPDARNTSGLQPALIASTPHAQPSPRQDIFINGTAVEIDTGEKSQTRIYWVFR